MKTESDELARIPRGTLLVILVIGLHLLFGRMLIVDTEARGHTTSANALEVTFFLSDTRPAEPSLIPDPPLKTFSSPPALLTPSAIDEDNDSPPSSMAITIPAPDPHVDCSARGNSEQVTSKPCVTATAPVSLQANGP